MRSDGRVEKGVQTQPQGWQAALELSIQSSCHLHLPDTAMTNWNECDAEALRAALSAVDDWDGSLAELCGFDSDYSSSSDVSRPMKSKTRHTTPPYPVKQRKHEITALRAEVEELQNIVALEKALDQDTPQSAGATMEETALTLEWERLASSQRHERFAAELENAKLRKLLQSHKKTAEKIMSLTKRVRVLEAALPAAQEAPSFTNYKMPHVDAQSQLQRLESLVPQAEEIFSSGAFAGSGSQCFREMHFRDTTPVVPAGKGVDFEIAAAWVLPFPMDRVVEALWLQTTRPSFRFKTAAFMDVYEDRSSVVTQFVSTPAEEWGASQGQMAVRHFLPNATDGSVLIGVTTQARAYVISKWSTNVHLDGWQQIKSITTSESQPLTQIKWHRHAIVKPPGDSLMTNGERCKWAHGIVCGPSRSVFEKNLDWSLQAIENLLLTRKDAES